MGTRKSRSKDPLEKHPTPVRFHLGDKRWLQEEGKAHPLGVTGVVRDAVKEYRERKLEEASIGHRLVQGME